MADDTAESGNGQSDAPSASALGARRLGALLPAALRKRFGKLTPEGRKGLKGMGWMGLSQSLTMLMRLVSSMVLTRLLNPGDYGVYGTALAVVMTLEAFTDTGIVPALIRHPRGNDPDYLLTGWTVNLGRGLIITAVMAALAWPLSIFYKKPEMFLILAVIGLRPTILSLRSPAIPTLRRELSFREVFQSELTQSVVEITCNVVLVWIFRSVWAIAVGAIIGAWASVTVSYVIRPMRPRWHWDPAIARDLAHLGRQVFFNTMLMSLWMNLDRVLGLRLIGAQQMGFYTAAWTMAVLAERFVNRVSSVYYAMLVKHDDPAQRRRWHTANSRRLTSWLMPALALGMLGAPLLIRVLFDARFRPAQVPAVILIGRLMLRTLARTQTQYLLSMAKLYLETRAYIISFLTQGVLIAVLVLLKRYNITTMALSTVATTWVLVAIQSWMLRLHAGLSTMPFWRTTAWMLTGLGLAWLIGSSPFAWVMGF